MVPRWFQRTRTHQNAWRRAFRDVARFREGMRWIAAGCVGPGGITESVALPLRAAAKRAPTRSRNLAVPLEKVEPSGWRPPLQTLTYKLASILPWIRWAIRSSGFGKRRDGASAIW